MKKFTALLAILSILINGVSVSHAVPVDTSSNNNILQTQTLVKNGSGGSIPATDTQAQVEAQKAAEDATAAAAAQKAAEEKAVQEAAAAKAKANADAAAKAASDAAAKTKAAQDKATADAAAVKASQDKATADKAAQEASEKAKAQQSAAKTAAEKAAKEKLEIKKETLEVVHCGKKQTSRDRIKCRLEADEKTLAAEYADDYKPESCIWRNSKKSDDWNNKWISNCKVRYTKVQACWPDGLRKENKYDGQSVIDCIKPILSLPKKLVPVAEHCAGKSDECVEQYRDAVHHLIIGRFYDAENRVELWQTEGKLDLDQTTNALIWITQHKKDFYTASSKFERQSVIKSFQNNWETTTNQL
jgi:chemotaxis protein histidine kinase CheA